MRAFDGTEKDYAHLNNSLSFLVSFWCTHGVSVYRRLDVVCYDYMLYILYFLVYCLYMGFSHYQ